MGKIGGSRCSDGERGEVAAQVGGEAASGRAAECYIAAAVAGRRRHQGRGHGAQDAVVRSHAAAIHGSQGGRHPGAAEEVLESGFVFVLQEACKSVSLCPHYSRLTIPPFVRYHRVNWTPEMLSDPRINFNWHPLGYHIFSLCASSTTTISIFIVFSLAMCELIELHCSCAQQHRSGSIEETASVEQADNLLFGDP